MKCRTMTKRMLSGFLAGAMALTQAAPAYSLPVSKEQRITGKTHTFATGKMTASLDVSQGGSLHLKRADGTTDWNHETGSMKMGATCILNKDGTENPSSVESQKESILVFGDRGMGSVQLGGDVEGNKSYFVFEDEIYFLGHGMKKRDVSNGDLTAATMVENMPTEYELSKLALVMPGLANRWAKGWVTAGLENTPTLADGPTKKYGNRNWIYASEPFAGSSAPDPGGYGYIFKDNLFTSCLTYQFLNSGKNFQAWLPHTEGGSSYSFSVAAAKNYAEMIKNDSGAKGGYSSNISELSNTAEVQAVYYDEAGGNGVTGARFWESSASGIKITAPVGDITAYHPLSLMISKEDEKTISAALSMPEGDAGKAVVEFGFASTSYETNDSGVTVETGDKTKVTLDNDILKGASVSLTFTKEDTEIRHEASDYGLTMELNPKSMLGALRLDRDETPGYYTDHYWDTINRNRIPGTVVLNTENKYVDGAGSLRTAASDSDWIGGQTVLGKQAVKGLELKGREVSGYQSYFLFPDKVVCLGAGLKNNSSSHSEEGLVAVLENYKLKDDLSDVINMSYANKSVNAWINTAGKAKETIWSRDNGGFANDNSWVYLKNPDLGYWFPKADMKKAEFRFTDGTSVGGAQKTWYELGLNLGTGENLTYEYAILPGVGGAVNVKTYFDKQAHITMANTSAVQAVYDTTSKTAGINFWSGQGGTVKNSNISTITVNGKASVLMQETEGKLSLAVSDPPRSNGGPLELTIERQGYGVLNSSSGVFVDLNTPGQIKLSVDLSQKDGSVFTAEINTLPDSIDDKAERVEVKRGDTVRLPVPADFTGVITWSSVFLKTDGTTVNNAGYSKYKRELKEGESEGTRKPGPVDASHIAEVQKLAGNDGLVKGNQKGSAVIRVSDETGKTKAWTVEVKYFSEDELPSPTEEDYETVRAAWRKSLIGSDLLSTEGGEEALAAIDQAASRAWNSYDYKGQEICGGIPWAEDQDSQGGSGNPEVPYEEDAIEFRQAYQKVLTMAKAYKSIGGTYYQNADMLSDMVNILDWLSENCYTPKSQTDNWWTWEIGLPKDLVPALILLYDDLTTEQRKKYSYGMLFFQPDPFHEGAVGNGSTHAQGYRESEGANLLDCSVTALGLGAILDDNELAYIGSYASSKEFVINTVEDTTKLSAVGFASGFYEDGSYMDHSHIPYLGAYGIEFFRGGVNLADLLHGTVWEYSDEVMGNLETYVVEGFGSCMYQGLMMDALMGRSLSRKGRSGKNAGRDAMGLILKFINSAGPEAKAKMERMLKNWLWADPEYIETLTGAADMEIRRTASEIYGNSVIDGTAEPMHKNMALMDRAFHRTGNYLFGLSMYSERIQNTEVMNNENLHGWHQSDGMTYLYDKDLEQYSDNFWSTINPYRLPGTTAVPVPIGNGVADGSGYYQDGDWRSYEKWVGGSSIGNYGINGMSLSGKNTSDKVTYAPDLKAQKSWFMFEDEIVCLGAGIRNQSAIYPTETIVENRRLSDSGSNELVVNGQIQNLELNETKVADIVSGQADTKGTKAEEVSWAHLEGSRGSQGTGYYFPEEGQTLHMRKSANQGNWAEIGTTEGEAVKNYMEMWFDHGNNPAGESYSYVLLPEKSADEIESYAFHPGIAILENSQDVQAVYNRSLHITGANFWKDSIKTAGDITCNKMASVMTQEDIEEGTLTIAVSDPTMKNTKTIEVIIERPVAEVINSDDNVEAEIGDDGFLHLTVHTKQKAGASSYATVRLEAGVDPAAITMARGENHTFRAIDYESGSEAFTWTVTGNKADPGQKTVIDDGLLTVDEKEPNDCLIITAASFNNPSVKATARVMLTGDVPVKIPDDITQIKNTVEELEHLLDPDADEDFGSHEVQQKVFAAVKAVKAADNWDLARYAFRQVVILEKLYCLAAEGKGRTYETAVHMEEELEEQIRDVKIEGALLSIPVSTATASNAVIEIRKTSAERPKATSSVAARSMADDSGSTHSARAPRKATGSSAVYETATSSDAVRSAKTGTDKIRKTATPSEAVPDQARIDGKEVDFIKEYLLDLDIQLILIELDGEKEKRKSIQPSTPIRLSMEIPFELDKGENIYVLHYHDSGEPDIQKVQILEDEAGMYFYITALSRFVIVKGVEQKADEPDKEKPSDEPDKESDEDKEEETEAVWPDAAGNWMQDVMGWWFQYPDGTYPLNQWEMIGGKWYHFNVEGFMETGWLFLSGKWYYLQPDGAMLKDGWVLWKERWYYCDSDGTMLADFLLFYKKEWYRLGPDGAWIES